MESIGIRHRNMLHEHTNRDGLYRVSAINFGVLTYYHTSTPPTNDGKKLRWLWVNALFYFRVVASIVLFPIAVVFISVYQPTVDYAIFKNSKLYSISIMLSLIVSTIGLVTIIKYLWQLQ